MSILLIPRLPLLPVRLHQFWDFQGNPIRAISGSAAALTGISYSVDDSKLVTTDELGLILLWDAGSGSFIDTLQIGSNNGITSTRLSDDRFSLGLGYEDGNH